MKKVLKSLLVFTLAISMVLSLAGCGGEKKVQLKVYNWGDYIDQSVIGDFEKKYNIDVVYDEFATNEEMYAKIKAGADDYDILVPSDYAIKRMIDEDMLYKLDMSNIPNYKYIDDRFKDLAYDPTNEYSVPYMWGTVGILYNKTMVKEPVDSWKILWDEKYSKQILMLDSLRDSIGITLKMMGYSLNTKDEKELNEAKELLIKQKPLVLAYVGDEVKDKMIGGEAALAVVWSGDAIYMKRENPDLEYVIPKEGSNIWFDAVVIPKSSQHKKEAELFINYLCETEVAFKNADFIGYATPHVEAKKMLPVDLTSDKSAYPEDGDLKNSEVFEDLAGSLPKYDRIWTEVKSK
ncbi:ABC transporter substrate-binding protein [Lutispora saccharofermentans]|uniref:Spermidine/putrescine ABC transporter substrate-binding protein n=1 Tax=Lutispora saccharofermentans TaxID=3024236 RepID=A0ABT1NAF6_9FIRM|nr:spermidine/putrescine ABC transporter substrate-binding protein [Lutispora saccharofermentans]MCQ1528238.1 spermidine/putrescine ABC transporter substrate-binding protein [Lutispora saccharofermentans]